MCERIALSVLFLSLWMVGCTTTASVASSAPTTIALVIRMAGGEAPSTHQAALVQKAIGPALTKAGLKLSPSLDDADYVITVTLSPDSSDPAKGHMAISGVQENVKKPKNALADAQASITELARWGESRSAPVYGP